MGFSPSVESSRLEGLAPEGTAPCEKQGLGLKHPSRTCFLRRARLESLQHDNLLIFPYHSELNRTSCASNRFARERHGTSKMDLPHRNRVCARANADGMQRI